MRDSRAVYNGQCWLKHSFLNKDKRRARGLIVLVRDVTISTVNRKSSSLTDILCGSLCICCGAALLYRAFLYKSTISPSHHATPLLISTHVNHCTALCQVKEKYNNQMLLLNFFFFYSSSDSSIFIKAHLFE